MALRIFLAVLLLLRCFDGSESFSTPSIAFDIIKHQATTPNHRTTTTLSAWRAACDSHNNRHSASDWWYNVKSINKSKVLQEVRGPVLAVGLWGFAVSAVHRVLQKSTTPLLQTIASHMSIPGTAHSFLVSALGLLLVFRTNSAYQRFYVRINPFIQKASVFSHAFVRYRKAEKSGRTSSR